MPRQAAEQVRGEGAGRRRAGAGAGAGAAELDVAQLSAALQRSVASIGAAGPPRAGLARIRRRAKARQRRRTVLAGSAGVMLLAVAVGAATGSGFDIVPVLTSVVGLDGGSTSSGAPSGDPQSAGGSKVRTVRPPAAVAGKKGPAIGPVLPTTTPSALAATGVAQCTAADLKTTASVDSVIDGVSYGHVEAVANTTCAVAGPPVLQVENVAGTAVSSVVILQHETSDGSLLPNVTTWGAVLKLQPGQGYGFQFAWAPDACTAGTTSGGAAGVSTAGASASASGGASAGAAGSGATGAAGAAAAGSNAQSAESAYSLSYLVAGATPTAPVDLDAACGATVYVTDVYSQGAYPLPQPPTASPTQAAPATSAPPASQAPTTQAPASGTPSSTDASPTTPSSSATTTDSGATGSGAGATGGAANATVAPTSS